MTVLSRHGLIIAAEHSLLVARCSLPGVSPTEHGIADAMVLSGYLKEAS
jgi:hypothetical protein